MFARMAVRIAAIEALRPWARLATKGPWHTPAGPLVFDSRLMPIDAIKDIEGRPALFVYTEQDEQTPYGSGQSIRPSGDVTVFLVIECAVAGQATFTFDDAAGGTRSIGSAGTVVADGELEAMVDFLEATVRRRLSGVDTDAGMKAWNCVCMAIEAIESVPQRDAEGGLRLALRTVRFKIKTKADAWPTTVKTGLDRLPEPLACVAKAMAGSDEAAFLEDLAAAVADPARIPLEGIDLFVGMDRVPTTEAEGHDARGAVDTD